MNAGPILARIAWLLERHSLDAILMGNAGAAIQGVPITTVDIDFLFCKTPANIKKLKSITRELNAVLLRPFYPASDLFRIQRDIDLLQLDFMAKMDGISSMEKLRQRATPVQFGSSSLLVGSLADILKSKKAAGRPQDLAALHILEEALAQAADKSKGPTGSSAKRE